MIVSVMLRDSVPVPAEAPWLKHDTLYYGEVILVAMIVMGLGGGIIITGANGNLGTAVTNKMLNSGYQVIATVINEEAKNSLPERPNLQREILDLTNETATAVFIQDMVTQHGHIDAALMLAGGFAAGSIAGFLASRPSWLLVQRWLLGPPGWTMPVCEMDVRVGGRYRWAWRSVTDESEFGFTGSVREVQPPVARPKQHILVLPHARDEPAVPPFALPTQHGGGHGNLGPGNRIGNERHVVR